MSVLSKNVGPTDKTIRIITGFVLIGIGLYIGSASIVWAVSLALLAVVLLVTAFTSTCPMYMPFGITTRQLRKRS
jgi:hypothetical protein